MPSSKDPAIEKRRIARMLKTRAANRKAGVRGRAGQQVKVGKAAKRLGTRLGSRWSKAQRARYAATTKRNRLEREAAKAEQALRRMGKQQLLNGNMPKRMGRPPKDSRLESVTVLQDDGTLQTYVLTTVRAYVRQP